MIKRILIRSLYFFIELIERIQYRNKDHSEKFFETHNIEDKDIQLLTDTGYQKATKLYITKPFQHYNIKLGCGSSLTCADDHVLFLHDGTEIFAKNVKVGDRLRSRFGAWKVTEISKKNIRTSMVDVTIDHPNHRYYTNNILSHNTISAAITILWYITFNEDKNVMIMANKRDTSVEVVDKLKGIYKLLPFFLQVGVKYWNQGSMTMENGCKIKTSGRSKTPAIGFSIDFLYLDEFAHIPNTIIRPYYTAVLPTMAGIQNSKIIITSTPCGYNLFHQLLTEAELEEGHPLKNRYEAMRCYWWQVPGRHVSYIRFNAFKMNTLGIDMDKVVEEVTELFMPNGETNSNRIPMVQLKLDNTNGKYTLHIQDTETRNSSHIRQMNFINNEGIHINVQEFAEVSSWREDEIKTIGGVDEFNQEYDLQFLSGSKALFDEVTMKRLENSKQDFINTRVDIMDRRLLWEYFSYLYFTKDVDTFNLVNAKKEKIVLTVDVAEGLGNDYSVINIFKMCMKSEEDIADHFKQFKKEIDFVQLKQIGLFRSNVVSTKQLAEMLYLLQFEVFDEENVKTVLEVNNHGHAVLAEMPNVFDGNNNYGSSVFMRFKHNVNDNRTGVGLKVGVNKNAMVKDYQDRVKNRSIILYEKMTIKEMTTFVKHETPGGGIKYKGDGAPDDIAMTIVHCSQAFDNYAFKDIAEDFYNQNKNPMIDKYYSKMMEQIQKNNDAVADHNAFAEARNSAIQQSAMRKRFM